MVLASTPEIGGVLGAHAAGRTTLDRFAACLAAQGARDPRPVHALALLEAEWQAADALLRAGELAGPLDRALAAAAIARAARQLAVNEWVARSGLGPLPLPTGPHADEMADAAGLGAIVATCPDASAEPTRSAFKLLGQTALAPLAAASHRQDRAFSDGVLEALAERGAFAFGAPAQFGRPDPAAQVAAVEALAESSLAAAHLVIRTAVVTSALALGATPAQLERWLPAIVAGRLPVALAPVGYEFGEERLLEARPVARGWALSGRMAWVPFAGRAEGLLVLARIGDAPGSLALFFITKTAHQGAEFRWEGPAGGAVTGRAIRPAGARGLKEFSLRFEGLVVGEDQLVGGQAGLGQGFDWLSAGLARGRLLTAAAAGGVASAAFALALARLPDADPVAGQRLADMALALQGARLLTYRTAGFLRHGDGAVQAALAKLQAVTMAERVTLEAMSLLGEASFADAHPAQRLALDARSLALTHGDPAALALHVVAPALIRAQVG